MREVLELLRCTALVILSLAYLYVAVRIGTRAWIRSMNEKRKREG